jgi:PAS domain S-box-containing protein
MNKNPATDTKTFRRAAAETLRLQAVAVTVAANAILITDCHGRILWGNPAFTRLVGYSVAELIGQTTALFKSGLQNQAFYAALWQTILAGQTWHGELINRRKDGTLYHGEMTIAPVGDAAGGIRHFVAVLQDVSSRIHFEKELARERELLQALMDNLPDFIYFKDTKCRFMRVNQAVVRHFGLQNPGEAVGKNAADFFPPDLARQKLADEQRVIATGRPLIGWIEQSLARQGVCWVSTTKVPIRNAAGTITGLAGISRDITEQMLVAEELRVQKEAFQALMDNLPDFIYFKDTQSRFTRINRALAQHFGLPNPEAAIGKSDADYYSPGLARQKLADEQCLIAAEQPLIGLVEKSGTILGDCWVSSTKVPIRGAEGAITGLVGISHDITEQMLVAEELRAQRASFQTLTDNIPDGIARLDRDLRFAYVNRVLGQDLGLTAETMTGKTPAELNLPSPEQWNGAIRRVLQTDRTDAFEYQYETAGTIRYFEARLIPEHDSIGRVQQVLAVTRNITGEKEAEKRRQLIEVQLHQSQKMEAIGQLAAGIAHEINTPTQYVGDNTRFLKDAFDNIVSLLRSHGELLTAAKQNTLTPEVLEQAEDVLAASDLEYFFLQVPQAIQETLEGVERITTIVRAMKEFSHPNSGGKAAADLNRAIESTTIVARNEWKYVADLNLDPDPELPLVPCFLGEFNQVILNLIVNAAHAISDVVRQHPETKGLITLQTRRDGDSVLVRVSDTGTGIPEAYRPRIFEPFFTTKEVGRGTGQGLTLVYHTIVKKHGGTITFETEVGKGTTFVIRLPLHPPEIPLPAAGEGAATP